MKMHDNKIINAILQAISGTYLFFSVTGIIYMIHWLLCVNA